MSDAGNLSQLFWAASRQEPLPTPKAEATGSCCGPKAEAKPVAETAPEAKKSSCCG